MPNRKIIAAGLVALAELAIAALGLAPNGELARALLAIPPVLAGYLVPDRPVLVVPNRETPEPEQE